MKFFKKSEEEEEGPDAKLEELRQLISSAGMPPEVRHIADKELEALARTGPATAEYTIGITYIDYLISMPWSKKTEDNLDLVSAERILNENHYGLHKIKERILEHLAVRVLVTGRKPRILIIDDEEIARKNLTHVLTKEAYSVSAASNGEEALKCLESEFDVVITDLKMPGIDGMEVLEKIKTKAPDTRVIMVTGYATVQSAVEAMHKGAFNYISKPFKLEEVRLTVKQAVEKKAQATSAKSSALCFTGPPGTGKTSLGMAIAKALGRKFVRLSLGGIKDEAEIRGHRRTYAGAKPGRIIEEIRRAGSANPVIMLDELDKIGRDFKGDPSSALLEVLDTEQNRSFADHYLDVPFDLSNVMFILTANLIDNITAPLRDRMEVINFSGYSLEEKAVIASRFLVPRQIQDKGLYEQPPVFTDKALYKIIQEYTKEAGIRNLERRIAAICRKIAKAFVQDKGKAGPLVMTPDLVEHYLGSRKYRSEVIEGKDRTGVTTGLVWTETGGDIIFVEAARMKGKNELILTGSLGDVMRESAQAALSYVRSNASSFGIPEDFFEDQDIHIHVPSGAIQKDGPSAGITIAMSLVSLLRNIPARREVAMTGEITLTGRVLPVGGIKEKVLAAKRAGVKTIILPEKNRAEVDELTDDIRKDIIIHLINNADDAVALVLKE